MTKKSKIQLYVSPERHRKFKGYAGIAGVTMSELLEVVIDSLDIGLISVDNLKDKLAEKPEQKEQISEQVSDNLAEKMAGQPEKAKHPTKRSRSSRRRKKRSR